MFSRFRSRMTYANVASTLALLFAVGTGGAYAANTIGSSDVINESLLAEDIKNGEVKSTEIKDGGVKDDDVGADAVRTGKILDGAVAEADLAGGAVTAAKLADSAVATARLADGAVTSAKVLDDTQAGGGLGPQDLAANSVSQSEIATDGVGAIEVQNDSIDSGEIVDFGLSNQDVGVLFAEVQASGTLDNSSGGVTVTHIGAAGTGTYEVDFGRDVTTCTAVATIGPSGGGSAVGEVNVADRGGNAEAVFVDTNASAGAAQDRPFRLVVVC